MATCIYSDRAAHKRVEAALVDWVRTTHPRAYSRGPRLQFAPGVRTELNNWDVCAAQAIGSCISIGLTEGDLTRMCRRQMSDAQGLE